jgi:energy-coupling factor transporter ATP-binding protein EcfA2
MKPIRLNCWENRNSMSEPSPPDPIQVLADVLATRFGLVDCKKDVAALRERRPGDPGGFVTGCRIRIGEYYDIEPAITVFDAGLGTLGFVERISSASAEADCLRTIERAAAVRQILINTADEKPRKSPNDPRNLALQVELVLVIADVAGSGTPDSLRAALTRIARETGFLRLAGVSILDASLHPELPDAALRRAFAWLLKDTRKWFERDVFRRNTSDSVPSWRKAGEPLQLRLKDYRLAGDREFHCDGKPWLTLVHGHNGSGKSSVAEALELLLTNRIQRLEEGGEKDYFLVVRHRHADVQDAGIEKASPAVVELVAGKDEVKALVRIEPGRLTRQGEKPDETVQANSFRIDQVFMDKLIRSQAAGRAALFLNAFSPGETNRLVELQSLRKEVSTSWQRLPEHVRKRAVEVMTLSTDGTPVNRALTEDEIAAFVLRELAPLAASSDGPDAQPATSTPLAELPRSSLEALLPSGSNDMARLAQLRTPLAESMQALLNVRDRPTLTQAAAQFQSNLTSLMASLPLLLADLKTAQMVFQEFQPWIATGRTQRGASFEADLRRWLDCQALADLISRYSDLASTIQVAGDGGWKPDSALSFLASLRPDAGKRNQEVVEQLHAARARIESWQRPQEPAKPDGGDPGKFRRWLSLREVEALNQVGKYLASAGCQDLGIRFNRALAHDHEEALGDMIIGRKGGLDQAIRETAEIIGACERLQQSAAAWTGDADPFLLIESLVKDARKLSALSQELPRSFFRKLASDKQERAELLAAFNELLALMTPARWAYRDIEITPDLDRGDPALGVTTAGGARADLMFNTAELNAFAMVLFLLLAPRLPNALRLLILDDPLQNMDELTVVTLARALAKLRPPVYPDGWQILALFHGERNVEVIRDETPCIVYQFPWLHSPGTKKLNAPAGEDTRSAPWQELTQELIAAAPL